MVELGKIWLFVVPFALAAALPGPAQEALIAQVLSRGAPATIPFVAGMVAGNAAWLLAAILGLSALAARFEPAFVAVKWLGVAYLLFVAWKLWTAPAADSQPPPRRQGWPLRRRNAHPREPQGGGFLRGRPAARLRPDDALSVGRHGDPGLGVTVDLAIQSIYLLAAGQARTLTRSARSVRLVNRSSAGLMAGAALLIGSRG